MTTIVMNTMNAAVTEWNTAITSVSGQHAGGAKLFSFGGDDDDGALIAATVLTPQTDMGTLERKRVPEVYPSLVAVGSSGSVRVKADGAEYDYPLVQRDDGMSRARPGMGIWAHRLAIGYANQDGADFRIDGIDAQITASKTRRIA